MNLGVFIVFIQNHTLIVIGVYSWNCNMGFGKCGKATIYIYFQGTRRVTTTKDLRTKTK